MRNLDQYPITLEEMVDAMNWAVAADNTDWEARGQPIGDIRGVALAQVRAMLLDKLEVHRMETRNDNDL